MASQPEPTTAEKLGRAAADLERTNLEAADALRRALAYVWTPNPDLHPDDERAWERISSTVAEGIQALDEQGATIGYVSTLGAVLAEAGEQS
jgi:hypothetical protein